ncbi:hypothetical protein ACFV2X_50325 [Streptomyces sp. NPDC059679]|uniref:hypothetical protein n=1 Tax=Streptomyces sp. NPDC059679 TaxID=3346903 RepID=UPI0036AD5E02
MPGEPAADLLGFDAVPVEFDLLVDAAQEQQVAVGVEADQVAGAVQAFADVGREPAEAAPGLELVAEVAGRQARASRVQLADPAERDEAVLAVEDLGAGAGDRAADRQRTVDRVARP